MEFWNNKAAPDGKQSLCKLCMKDSQKRKGQMEKDGRQSLKVLKGAVVPSFYDQPEKIRVVAQAWIENPNATIGQISKITNLPYNQINFYCYHNPYLKVFRQLAQKKVKNLIPLALKGLESCLRNEDARIRLTAALEILKSEKILGAERVDVTVEDIRSRPIKEVHRLVQEAKLIPLPSISETEVIGTDNVN